MTLEAMQSRLLLRQCKIYFEPAITRARAASFIENAAYKHEWQLAGVDPLPVANGKGPSFLLACTTSSSKQRILNRLRTEPSEA